MTRPLTRSALAAVGFVLALALAGCDLVDPQAQPSQTVTVTGPATITESPSPTPSTAQQGPLSGVWNGVWINTSPVAATGTFTLVWAQQGSQLFGALTVEGSNCLANGNVEGVIFGTRLRFGAVEGAVEIEYDGALVDEDTIEGTYESDCGPSEGTWSATRSPI